MRDGQMRDGQMRDGLTSFADMAIPNGWFAVAFSHEVSCGQAVASQAFGEDLVVWRTEDGAVSAMDAYCPHMGAHFGHGGVIRGDTISCPFHGWSFDCTGKLQNVPYETIKPAAQQRTWPVNEQDGVILVWHHAEGHEPSWEMETFDQDGWSVPITREWTLQSHPQDICENGFDVAHIRFVHKATPQQVTKTSVNSSVLSVEVALLDEQGNDSGRRVTNEAHGPGLVLGRLSEGAIRGLFRLYPTPLGKGQIVLRGIASVKVPDRADAAKLESIIVNSVIEQWEQDLPIWRNKKVRSKPLLTRSEGAIADYRRWYQRFYESEWCVAG